VAEEVVEDIRVDQIVELVSFADLNRYRKLVAREMREEMFLGNEPRHCHDAPAGTRLQYSIAVL
jgi:hypothetical protein